MRRDLCGSVLVKVLAPIQMASRHGALVEGHFRGETPHGMAGSNQKEKGRGKNVYSSGLGLSNPFPPTSLHLPTSHLAVNIYVN